MGTVVFTIEVEDVDSDGGKISGRKILKLLSDMEEVVGKLGFDLYDSNWSREE